MIPEKLKVEEIIKELQKVLMITDIEIYYYPSTKAEMSYHTSDADNLAYFSFNRKRNCADVYLNIDDSANEKEWYDSIVHELIHLATMQYRDRQLEGYRFIPESIMENVTNDTNVYYESMIDKLTRIFIALYPVTNFIKGE